jgi:hypothetical protein
MHNGRIYARPAERISQHHVNLDISLTR